MSEEMLEKTGPELDMDDEALQASDLARGEESTKQEED